MLMEIFYTVAAAGSTAGVKKQGRSDAVPFVVLYDFFKLTLKIFHFVTPYINQAGNILSHFAFFLNSF